MASYHFALKHKPKGFGKAHALYIMREGKYENLRSEEQMEENQSGNMPSWAESPEDFWQAADKHERVNGRVYSEMEVALPNELNCEQRKELVAEFVKEQLGESYVYTYCIHNKKAALDNQVGQPHAHIMFSQRQLDGIERNQDLFFKRANSKQPERGGTKKNEEWKQEKKLFELRKNWCEIQNAHLEKYGHDTRVDHRTLKEQKIEAIQQGNLLKAELLDRPADIHLGPKKTRQMQKEQKKFQLENPNNTPEQSEEEYIDQCKSEKISHSLMARRLKKIKTEIVQEYPDLVLENQVKVPDTVQEIDTRLSVIEKEIIAIRKQQNAFVMDVKIEQDARNIARYKMFKGLSENEINKRLVNPETEKKFKQIQRNVLLKNKETRDQFALLTIKEKVLLAEKRVLQSGRYHQPRNVNQYQIKQKAESINKMYPAQNSKDQRIQIPDKRDQIINRVKVLEQQIHKLSQKKNEIAYLVKDEKDALSFAQDKVFGEQSKTIRQNEERLNQEKEKLARMETLFAKQPKPNILQRQARKEWKDRTEKLQQWRNNLNQKLLRQEKIRTDFEIKKEDPVNKQKVFEIQKAYLLNTEKVRQEFHKLNLKERDLKNEKKVLQTYLKQTKIQDKKHYISRIRTASIAVKAKNSINKAIQQLREERCMGGIQAKIMRRDREEEWER